MCMKIGDLNLVKTEIKDYMISLSDNCLIWTLLWVAIFKLRLELYRVMIFRRTAGINLRFVRFSWGMRKS